MAEVEVVDIVKKYGDYLALRGVSLRVEKGSFTCVVGPSGSGKSTLLHIMGGLDRPDSGRVVIDGVDITGMSDDELSEFRNRNIGFVFQMFYLIPRLSILENVELPLILRGVPRDERRRMALESLRAVGLGHIDPRRRPTQLSGGEQQRVAIARAIVGRPRLLLADEPTGNLDTANTRIVMELFQRLRSEMGITIVMVTHNLELLPYCDVVAKMRDGQVIELISKTRELGP